MAAGEISYHLVPYIVPKAKVDRVPKRTYIVPQRRISYKQKTHLVPQGLISNHLVPYLVPKAEADQVPKRTHLVPKGRIQCGPYINGLCYSKIHHSYLRYTTGCTSSWSLELLEPADKIGSERKKPENYKKQKIADQKGNCLFQEGNCRQLPFWTCFSIELPF
jgi:hypothetical protein